MEEKETKLDWKNLLHDFLSIDEKDYSFTPPDKRYDSSPFFLPDFNLEGMKIKNILVFVDTSGSMSYLIVKEILEEIKAAISDSECGLKGWLGFFDAGVIEPVPINEEWDMNDRWEKYIKLMKERPELFCSSKMIEIVTDEKVVRDYEQETGKKIGVLYDSPYNILVVDLICSEKGTNYT